MEKKRPHRKVVITKVHPRSQWVALRTKNQRLIFGYLVAKTSIKRKGIQCRLDRHEVLTEKELRWNGIYVTNAELAEFLDATTGLSKESCRIAITRAIKHLTKVNYIVLHGKQLKNQHSALRAIEVLWDDKNYNFISPLKIEKSNSAVTKVEACRDKNQTCRDSAVTKVASAVTKVDIFVTPPNATYGQVKPQNRDFAGAYINNKIINNGLTHNNDASDGALFFSDPSKSETEREIPATLASMIPGVEFYNQDDLLPAFRVRQDRLRTRVDKPADLLSFFDTPGVKGEVFAPAVRQLIKHINAKYGYDCSSIFEAENYRRLICPDLRADIPLAFGPAPADLTDNRCPVLPEIFDRNMATKFFQDMPDMFHRVVSLFRMAPRGIYYQHDSGGYWSPPEMPLALDYSSYTRSSKTTESKFHRDATTSQLREIINANHLPDVEVNGKTFSGLHFNIVLKRQIFWLAGTTALSREALEGMLPRFEKELLHNSKSPDFVRYKKKMETGQFGETNLINWFKDLCFRYHYHGWYIDRLKNDEGGLFLPGLGASCDTSGAATGTIAYIPTPWGQTREMFFTDAQWKMYGKFKNTLYLNDIGQDAS